ncbi:hypothetical protein C7M84_007698 [Penaeus vannamei]|uniref:VWFD domain-containing protein n=1 Tax=Penaeus vannamei TaxID=6689 RepID=A0A3R7PQD4_PENVA|nr:hypothetical protein C7M84_007698 [Penaeus vannamei]
MWKFDHTLQLTERSLENLLTGKMGDESYKVMTNLYDQTEDLFKYHAEVELSLPAWHFSYVDTLQQRYEGDVVGQSTTVMPSGRVYSSSSRYFKGKDGDRLVFDFSYDILVRDGVDTWKIAARESFEWSSNLLNLHCGLEIGDVTLFGFEMTLDGSSSDEVDLFLKTWTRNVYEGELALNSVGPKTDINFMVFVIPLNREIKSKVALGHDGCLGGSVDGELAWDVRGDHTKTLTVSSAIQFPAETRTLVLKGAVTVLTWTWKTELQVEFGDEVGDNHSVTFALTLPDESRLEAGSQLIFSLGNNDLALGMTFDLRLPSGTFHNVSLVARGHRTSHGLADGMVSLNIDSPVTDDVHFRLHVKKQEGDGRTDVGVTLTSLSGANYWDPISGKATWLWDGTRANVVTEVTWGDMTINFDALGSYKIVQGEHQLLGSAELRVPEEAPIIWQQLKATVVGTFSASDNPSKLKMSHTIVVYKDYREILNTDGEVTIQVPKAEGRLSLSHSGSVATHHVYTMTGTFTGKELEVDVKGTVDDAPVSISVHYIDGREVTVQGSYREEGYLSVAFRTELKDISIGIRKGNGTSFSLTSDGQVVYRGSRTKLHHQLSITPSRASSFFRLSPFLGRVLKTSSSFYNTLPSIPNFSLNHTKKLLRYKLSHLSPHINQLSADDLSLSLTPHPSNTTPLSTLVGQNVDLSWGARNFTYRDDVHFRTFRDCTIRLEMDAPHLNFDKVTVKLESNLEGEGEQAVHGMYLVHNATLHSARLTYYTHDVEEERVWQAGVSDLVVNARSYSDLMVRHALALPGGGVQIKSNLTVDATPVVGVTVTHTSETRALLLSVCSTSEECVRLQAHAHARSTPSTRTYSVAAHALNSLFWQTPDDPLVQNSEVMVTGGIRRVECQRVTCETFENRGLLHATLRLTPETLDLLLDTTNRTVQLLTVSRQNVVEEAEISSLPGGRLVSSSNLETRLWLDRTGDPEGVVTWNSSVAHYASSRASEWAVHSRLHHNSFDKSGRQYRGRPIVHSCRLALLLDMFSALEDALRLDLEILQDSGNHILVANLTKTMSASPRILDVVASFLPSPDSAQVSVVMLVPSWRPDPYQHHETQFDSRFTLTCGLDTGHRYRHATADCTLTTPSVREKILLEYHLIGSGGCKGLGASVGMFNRTYLAEQKSCLSPSSIQASLALKTAGQLEDEMALRLGLVDSRRAEMDLLDAVHIKFQLHPPFLLHAMAHSRGTMWSRWSDFKDGIQDELDDIIRTAKSVTRAMATDLDVMDGLARMASPSPAHMLATHSRHHVLMMVEELRNDQLLKDIAQLARACVDVTSVMVEATVAYISHNFGDLISEVVVGVRVWTEAAVTNAGFLLMQIIEGLKETISATANFVSDLPRMVLDQALSVPMVSDAVDWIMTYVRYVQGSKVYAFLTTATRTTVHYVHKLFSLVYPWNGTPYSSEVAAGVWNIWIPLPECGHSLFDVWHLLTGSTRAARHRLTFPAAVQRWWHLFTHPSELFHRVVPPFTGYGAIVGENHFITLDGLTYALTPSCAHVLATDARGGLFTLVSSFNATQNRREYTLFLGDTTLKVLADLQVEVDGDRVPLPYSSAVLSVKRDPQLLSLSAKDSLGRDLVTVSCWDSYHACVVGVSGWLHGDTRGLLGHYDLDLTNELMRPSGGVALSGEVFSQSWQVGANCSPDQVSLEIPSNNRAHHLCRKFLLHYGSAAFPCHDYVDVQPFYKTCVSHLSQIQERKGRPGPAARKRGMASRRMPRRVLPRRPPGAAGEPPRVSRMPEHRAPRPKMINNLLFLYNQDYAEATGEEMEASCNVLAAYSSVCSRNDVKLLPPRPCARKGKLSYEEPMTQPPELDVVMLVDENTCDDFIYEHLVGPLPGVLKRIAQGKNVSDVKMGLLGYGSGGGDLVYYSASSFLSSASRLRKTRPQDTQLPRASLLQGMRAISHFPFRPGSIRVGLVVRCSDQDLPQVWRPKAVRNTIGVDRWHVYNLRNERHHTKDSWSVRKPDSNVAKLAFQSGGGVFTVTPLRDESKAAYYMKLFRKVLSRAIVKVVHSAEDDRSTRQA